MLDGRTRGIARVVLIALQHADGFGEAHHAMLHVDRGCVEILMRDHLRSIG